MVLLLDKMENQNGFQMMYQEPAASFQETTKVLSEAAIRGKVDEPLYHSPLYTIYTYIICS